MKLIKIALICIVLIIVLGGIFTFKTSHKHFNEIKPMLLYKSGLNSAQWTIQNAIKEYYNNNGKYPIKLAELSNLVFDNEAFSGLGATDQNGILSKFNYKATETSYEISADYMEESALKTAKEFGEKGQIVAVEFYTGGKLNERIETPNDAINIRKEYLEGKLVSETTYDSKMNIISQKRY